MNFNQSNKTNFNNIKIAADYAAQKMPSVNKNHPNPIETLSLEDIKYLQSYLEQIKAKKMSAKVLYNNPDYNEPRNGFGVGNGVLSEKNNLPTRISNTPQGFLDNTTKNRANEIYDPFNRKVPVDWRTYDNQINNQILNPNIEPGSRGSACTRMGKRSQQNMGLDQINDYHNPYEYGAKQNSLLPQYKPTYNGPYDIDPVVLNQMGVNNNQNSAPNHIRNINVESSLLQRETTHLPGQRTVTEKEQNRFELLPFDPQDHRHIVWTDNMPRGGYPTRTDRLEL